MSVVRISLIASACLLVYAAFTAPVGAAGETKGACARELLHMDADGNGAVDADEFAAARRMAAIILELDWDGCDRNANGLISAHEFDEAIRDASEAVNSRAAVSVTTLLADLQSDARYQAEIAALREELADLDDDDRIITHIVSNTTRYPYLSVVARTWPRYKLAKPKHHARTHERRRSHPHPAHNTVKPPKARKPGHAAGPKRNGPKKAGPKPVGRQGGMHKRGR